jgi:hypothetical protein
MKDHKCDRCGSSLTGKASSMSMFNTDVLCWDCVEKEQAHKLLATPVGRSAGRWRKATAIIKGSVNRRTCNGSGSETGLRH